jgi:WD40 repeat protein
MNTYKYVAFISYQRKDEEWAKWLHHQLEYYRLPVNSGQDDSNAINSLRPIFLDEAELAGGILSEGIEDALSHSKFLIVLCSPASARSIWVNKEVQYFIDQGNIQNIIPVIIDGCPYSANVDEECFGPALYNLKGSENELLGINAKFGREVASVKIVSQMIGVGFDALWNRYEREKESERQRQLEEKRRLQRIESRYLSEKGFKILQEGDAYLARRIAINALPEDFNSAEDRPFIGSAGELLLRAFQKDDTIIKFISAAYCASYSPDGKLIASGGVSQGLQIWNAITGQIIKRIGSESIGHLCFSPDCKKVACSEYERLAVYDLNGDYWAREVRGVRGMSRVDCVEYTKDGKYIASTCFTTHEIILWDAASLEEITRFRGHTDQIKCLNFSSSGKTLVSGSKDETIRYWNVETGECIEYVDGFDSTVFSVCFNSDVTKLLVGLGSGHVLLLDTDNVSILKKFSDHDRAVLSVRFSPDEKKIISASEDKTAVVREIDPDLSGPLIMPKKIEHADIVFCAEMSKDGKQVVTASSDYSIKISDVTERQPYNLRFEYIYSNGQKHCYTPNSRQIYIAGRLRNEKSKMLIRRWDLRSDARTDKTIETEQGIGKILLTNDAKYLILSLFDKRIILMDAKKMKILKEIKVDKLFARATHLCNNDKEIMVVTEDGFVYFRDLETFEEVRPHYKTNFYLRVDARIVLDKTENILIFADNNCGISIHDLSERTSKRLIFTSYTRGLDISPDSKILAVSDSQNIILWDLHYHKSIKELKGHETAVRACKFSPDGNYLLTCDEDTIKLWDIKSGECFNNFNHHEARIEHVDFSPDGKKCVSIDDSGYIKLWDFVPLQGVIDITRKRFAGYDFTDEEKVLLSID